jgi:EAL domain-containing protein (putative c-di-GMP-specific phosphodiesterase class I)
MYRAKERGRARCELFDAEMRARAARRLEVERDLRDALANDELQLHYQPLVDLRSGEIISLEALLRWEHPRRGVLEPEEFISVAEECGLIGPIGRWVEETACRQAVEWQGLRPDRRPLDVSVNISARQVAHRELADSVGDVLARTGLDPIHLQLEVTETILVDESAMATTTLEALGELGVRLVLDDFGTGYSSLAYLSRFPFDALKIDRSFIEGLGVEQERTAIVEAIIGMARALSLDAIAVGVESDIQLAELRRIGCDYGQGHLFSRPLPAADITRLIRDGELELLGNSAR